MRVPQTIQPLVRVLMPAAIAGGLCINAAVAAWALITRPELNSDFRGPWSFANFARHLPAGQIYQPASLLAYQHQLYAGFQSFFPYQYPPSFLPAIAWMADFSYPAAQLIWSLAGLIAMIAASWNFFEPQLRWIAILALLAAPASLLNGMAGETGYFTTALLLAGFGLLPARPALAGICFGLLTLKPQLGLLVPLALLARGDHRAMLAAGLTALALVATSCAMFPARLWADWLYRMPIYQSQYLADGKAPGMDAGVTIGGNLLRLGCDPAAAGNLQAIAGLAVAAVVFLAFSRAPYRLAVAALFAGTFLCTPHAYAYDTLPLTAAMLLPQQQASGWVVLCIATYLAPYLLLTGEAGRFLYAFPEILLFLWIIYLAFAALPRPDIRHEPVPATEFKPRGQ